MIYSYLYASLSPVSDFTFVPSTFARQTAAGSLSNIVLKKKKLLQVKMYFQKKILHGSAPALTGSTHDKNTTGLYALLIA